jgi:deoxyhypusine monooxygenase
MCDNILKMEKDESLRVEAIWALGISLEEVEDDSLCEKIEDVIADVLKNDSNIVVRHEAGFQLGERGVYRKLPLMLNTALNDPSDLVRHETIEAIGIMGAINAIDELKKALNDKSEAVRATAQIVIKQLNRLEKM